MAAAFRLYSKLESFRGQSGQILAGGYLKFYTAGSTVPKDVFGEEALSTNNGSTVDLDSAGRPTVDVWGSGSYFVELFDADGVKQAEADNVQVSGGEATALPALIADRYLTNDGAVMSWGEVRQVPDPTGQANKVLSTDGTTLSWIDKPADGAAGAAPADPDIAVTSTSLRAGVSTSSTKYLIQTGSSTCAASGTTSANSAVVFPVPFSACTHVSITPTSDSNAAPIIAYLLSPATATGFSAGFDPAEGGSSTKNITNPIPFTWIAFGTVEVP